MPSAAETISIETWKDWDAAGRRAQLVDVRSIPRSRTTPRFNKGTLPDAVAAEGIGVLNWWVCVSGGRAHLNADIVLGTPCRLGRGRLERLPKKTLKADECAAGQERAGAMGDPTAAARL